MDIPPSSYHDSLEELWDGEEEPEEIEAVMKVVPSVYHQYMDVFSNVKAEKIPPHRTCDHHIKLEGSVPPVEVIYSLSNQESDTLRAYISENVEKVFIRPSSSPTGAPVLFIKKKDGGLHFSLTSFLKKDSRVPLNEEALRHFHQLKEEFTIAPILSHFYPSLPTIVVTDASAYALGAVLSHISDKGKHLIAFDSHKLLPVELTYEIHDKELLGIVWALKRWRAFLLSLSSSFEVLTKSFLTSVFYVTKDSHLPSSPLG
ncbi:hypothetical protein O181_112326 [Austropuccinia psidii MF-1]|uniref:Reverse transcriptase/retrotransposon-derived protein RNase H-like domain-containing protein n=1 Tax=Austropuccinia psidii MF-1 TaxID=1389203 RepID=A0A9Q3K284_9BASI|nr:hypothetical protein [Austropuccinia psidii MF-1]